MMSSSFAAIIRMGTRANGQAFMIPFCLEKSLSIPISIRCLVKLCFARRAVYSLTLADSLVCKDSNQQSWSKGEVQRSAVCRVLVFLNEVEGPLYDKILQAVSNKKLP